MSPAVEKALHKTIKKVSEDIESMKYNTAIASMMSLVNEISANTVYVPRGYLSLDNDSSENKTRTRKKVVLSEKEEKQKNTRLF